jgi:DNA polymerase elongation subunit (family B)
MAGTRNVIEMLFFDIETRANPQTINFMEKPNAPSNYKDPEKIQAYVDKKMEEQIEKAALDADFGQIVAIGVKEDDGEIMSWVANSSRVGDEKDALIWFWQKLKMHTGYCCGYNIINFDLPYLMRRSFDLGIEIPFLPDLRRYSTQPTLDLMMVLYNWSGYKSLKFVAERYGLDNPLPELEGSQVENMDAETLKLYVENDVSLVYQLYQKMNGIYF